MAQAYQETTEWDDGNTAINHTYLMEGDSILAYIRRGTSSEFWFKAPIKISRSRRKFKLVEPSPFTGIGGRVADSTREVEGSNGSKYIVNLDDKSCTCPGYTFRGSCKHTKELA